MNKSYHGEKGNCENKYEYSVQNGYNFAHEDCDNVVNDSERGSDEDCSEMKG